MNKKVRIDCHLLTRKEEEFMFLDSGVAWEEFDAICFEYGMDGLDVSYGLYHVVDESKFTMFMLKYPRYILKISYE